MSGTLQKTEEVSFSGKKVPLKAYVAHPDTPARLPAVIVIQEWWGLNDHIKDVTRRFAAEGYFGIAPDLYSRQGHKVTADPNEAGQLMAALKKEDGIEDLISTIEWLKQNPAVRAERIGTIGFCMGGSYALLLPCKTRDISAAAVFYGEIPDDQTLQNVSCPIFYAYGENDGWIQRKDVERLAAALKKLGKAGEVKTYPGCSHGFFNDSRKDVYSSVETADAWRHVLSLFEQNLKVLGATASD